MNEYVEFRGSDRRGAGVTGHSKLTEQEAGDFIERSYRAGWRSLIVTRDGRTVGEIFRLDGRRLWWSE